MLKITALKVVGENIYAFKMSTIYVKCSFTAYLTTISVVNRIKVCVKDKLERMCKETVVAYFKVLARH